MSLSEHEHLAYTDPPWNCLAEKKQKNLLNSFGNHQHRYHGELRQCCHGNPLVGSPLVAQTDNSWSLWDKSVGNGVGMDCNVSYTSVVDWSIFLLHWLILQTVKHFPAVYHSVNNNNNIEISLICFIKTLWCPMLSYGYSCHPVPDLVKPSFVIFDIWALWRSDLSVRVPRCQKL